MGEFDKIDVGKIFAWFDEDQDNWFLMRYTGIVDSEDKCKYQFRYLDDNFRMISHSPVGEVVDQERFEEIKREWITLSSDGIAAVSNVVAMSEEEFGTTIKDVISIFFPVNKAGVANIKEPYVVARQGFSDIYDLTNSEAGVSVSLHTLPQGYALADFMQNESVINSTLCHVYKTDTYKDLALLLDNKDTTEILKDMYHHAVMFNKNTIPEYEHEEKENDVVNGYCNSLEAFFDKVKFMDDILGVIGVSKVDFELSNNEIIDGDNLLLLSTIYGGIRINKAAALKFNYDIDLSLIKFKFLLVSDKNDILYIIYYTEFEDEISAEAVYKITQDRTNIIHERLKKIARAYDFNQ